MLLQKNKSSAIMQGLLSVMMLGMTSILGTFKIKETADLLQGSFGIYYKIMQFALFAAFGVSNTIISILSFNYGMKIVWWTFPIVEFVTAAISAVILKFVYNKKVYLMEENSVQDINAV